MNTWNKSGRARMGASLGFFVAALALIVSPRSGIAQAPAATPASGKYTSVSEAGGELIPMKTENVPFGDSNPDLKDRGDYIPIPLVDLPKTPDELQTGKDVPPLPANPAQKPTGTVPLRSLGMTEVKLPPLHASDPSGTPGSHADPVADSAPALRTHRAADPQQEILKLQGEFEQYRAEESEYETQVKGHLDEAVKQLVDTVLDNYAKAAAGAIGGAKLEEDVAFHIANLNMLRDAVGAEKSADVAKAVMQRAVEAVLSSDLLKSTAAKMAGGAAPSVFETVMRMLTLHEDEKQRDSLDRWRESIQQRLAFWMREQQKTLADRGQSKPPVSRAPAPGPVTTQLRQAGIETANANEAAAQGKARIGGISRQGYSLTEIRASNLTNNWLALDFSGSFFQPGNNSGSQRIGLVSAVPASTASSFNPRRQILLAAVKYPPSLQRYLAQSNSTRETFRSSAPVQSYARENWVVIAPRGTASVMFTSVCLDHSRGVPHQAEELTMSSVPLPGRLQRIVLTGAYRQSVPQSDVWGTISREHLSWFDARTGFQARGAFQSGDWEGAISLLRPVLDITYDDPEILWMMGMSLYRQGLREQNDAKAAEYLVRSSDFLLDAIDLGHEVTLAVKHHKGFGPLQRLDDATVTITRAQVTVRAQNGQIFASARVGISLSSDRERDSRISVAIDERGKKTVYNLYPETCGMTKESMKLGANHSIPLSSVACGRASTVASALLERVIGGN